MGVDAHGTLITRPDTVLPVVLVRKAAARPAHDGHLEFLQGLDDVVAIAARVRNRRVLSYPDALVDTAPEVLGELPIEIARNLCAGLVRMNGDRRGLRVHTACSRNPRDSARGTPVSMSDAFQLRVPPNVCGLSRHVSTNGSTIIRLPFKNTYATS